MGASGAGSPWRGPSGAGELGGREVDVLGWWAWEVYSYSGAGDGSDYGDDIVYDLVNKKVTTSEWFTEQRYEEGEEGSLTVAEDE